MKSLTLNLNAKDLNTMLKIIRFQEAGDCKNDNDAV